MGSQGTPGKQGESAQVTQRDGLTPAVKSGSSSCTAGENALVAVWFCEDAVVFLSLEEALLVLEAVASGRVLLSGGRLDEVEEEDEEVVVDPLLGFDLLM